MSMNKARILTVFAAAAVSLSASDLERALKTHLDEFARSQKNVTTRDLTNAALLNLMLGRSATRSEEWIERAYATQDLDPASKTFGELKWNTGDASVTDLNAIEFGTQAIGPLYLTYRDKLSTAFKDRMHPHLKAALAGLRGHKVAVSYTNIFLMNLVSGMLIGQAIGDVEAVRNAGQQFDIWNEYTRQNGIHEFNSPTYYACDLNSLVEGFRYAASADDRRKFERALDYFWMDIAASYMRGAQRMVGPYSRDYDFLRGRGGMDVWLTDAGWASIPQKSLDFEKVFVLDNAREGGYRPKKDAIALADRLPREVVSAWDENPMHGRFSWIGKDVSIGCTSGDYNAQDKLFNATFAGSAGSTQMSVVPDIFDAPYGLVKNPDKTGHMKPTHLPLHAACVESAGIALFTLDLDPSAVPADAKGFATNLLLPGEAKVAWDRESGSVTMGDATVFMRLIHVDGTPTVSLEHTRLKIQHLAPGESTKEKHLRVALLIGIRDVAGAKVSSELRDGMWTVRAALPGLSLELQRDQADRKKIAAQKVNGEPVARMVLAIDGKSIEF
jgi:hypothetical protein